MEKLDNYFTREIELEHCNKTLTLYQQTIGGVNCVVWDAAIVLVKYLDLTNKDNKWLKGKKVLELGAGLGCAGIAAACFGAEVILTDLDSALPLLQKNIYANENQWKPSGGSAIAQVLDWSNNNNELNFHPDIILVTDCVYYKESLQKLLDTFEKLCTNENTYILLSQEERDTSQQIQIWASFVHDLRQKFEVIPIPTSCQHSIYSSPDIHLMKIRKSI